MALPESAPAARPREEGLDLLRGIAILGVVVFHLWVFTQHDLNFPPRHSTLLAATADRLERGELAPAFISASEVAFRSGRDGVSMFMILSGTALTLSVLRAGGAVDLLVFYRRRVGRLLRSYWAGFAVVIGSLVALGALETRIDGGSFRHNWSHVGPDAYFDQDQVLAGLAMLPRVWKLDWVFAPPPTLWFVLLLLQFYLLFPFLLRAAQRVGIAPIVAIALAVSVGSAAVLYRHYDGHLGFQGWIPIIWSPFRLLDFALGMALGYVMARHVAAARRWLGGPVQTAACIVGGVVLYLAGTVIEEQANYRGIVALPTIATGLTIAALPMLIKAPGRLEASWLGRVLVWIGPMSLAVLIMNEPFRFIDHYLWVKELRWTAGWWAYVVAVYVPGTLLAGAALSRLLGLTPSGHPLRLFRGRQPQT